MQMPGYAAYFSTLLGLIFIEFDRGPLYFAHQIFIWRTEFATGFSFCMNAELIK